MKDPETGKRQARPNDEASPIITDAPELRVIDQDLWGAVKHRQAETAIKGTGLRSEARRRTVHLFSGLMICGVCGGGVSMIADDRVGCSSARNNGDTVCTNRRTVSRSSVETRVLHALSEHLMEPEHGPFPPSERLARFLDPVAPPASGHPPILGASLLERRPVGAELVRHQLLRLARVASSAS